MIRSYCGIAAEDLIARAGASDSLRLALPERSSAPVLPAGYSASSAVAIIGDDKLKLIAAELITQVLANQRIVLRMRSDPEPQNAVRNINTERSMVMPNAHGAKSTNLLEVQSRMSRIGLKSEKFLSARSRT